MHRFLTLIVAGLLVTGTGLCPVPGHAQIREFDFYATFRQWVMTLPIPERRQVDVLQHTVERGKSDFFSRQDLDIIRFLAEKPRQ